MTPSQRLEQAGRETPLLIALCSPAMGSGKSTLAAHLVESHGFVKVAFASALKEMTCALLCNLGMTPCEVRDHVYGDSKEVPIDELGGTTSRWIQQSLGTEWGRELIHPDIWVQIAMSAVRHHREEGRPVVIDDMRFPNELEAVRAAGGRPLRVIRGSASVPRSHASEGQIDAEPMAQIVNGGTIAELLDSFDLWLALHTESPYS